jgi:hypothetical protein
MTHTIFSGACLFWYTSHFIGTEDQVCDLSDHNSRINLVCIVAVDSGVVVEDITSNCYCSDVRSSHTMEGDFTNTSINCVTSKSDSRRSR